MSQHITFPEFKFNRQFATAESIQKYAGTTHGLTLTALSLVDQANRDLQIEVACVGESQLQDFASQIRGILHQSKVIKIYFRSVKVNGVFQDSYEDSNLEHDDSAPCSPEQYKNKANSICDIEINGDGQVWKFWRNPENAPRVLKLIAK